MNEATTTRLGEEIDIVTLNKYSKEIDCEIGEILEIQQYPGGFSNLTYLLKTTTGEYVLRRAPFGANIKSAHDMAREYNVLTKLNPHYKSIPKTIHFCEIETVIGAIFYIMQKVDGVILRGKNVKSYNFESKQMRFLSEKLIDNLADLHQIDIESSGLNQLGKPDGYVNRQVEGWIGRYEKSKTDEIEEMIKISTWLQVNKPREQKPAFLHNDYKYDNVVFDDKLENINAVLDWEMATVGDPLMDLGATLAYWGQEGDGQFVKSMNITWLAGNLTRAEVVERYQQKTGIDVSDILFYYVFGLFKNAVIMQQIYYRWKNGHTKDARFEQAINGVKELAQMAVSSIINNKIS